MKEYTNNNPVFSDAITIVEYGDPVYADVVNEATEQLLDNELVLKNAICHYTKTATLPAGQSVVTFDITGMPEDGIATFVSSSPSLSYTGVSEDTSTKQLTVTFAPVQDTDVTVKLIVKDALE